MLRMKRFMEGLWPERLELHDLYRQLWTEPASAGVPAPNHTERHPVVPRVVPRIAPAPATPALELSDPPESPPVPRPRPVEDDDLLDALAQDVAYAKQDS